MQIEIHGLNVVLHQMTENDILELLNIIKIEHELFESKEFSEDLITQEMKKNGLNNLTGLLLMGKGGTP